MLSQKKCVPCEGGVEALPKDKAGALLKELDGWEISKDNNWLLKDFTFKNFVEAMAFVSKVGEIAEREQHHPDIGLGWGYVHIGLQTHAIGGLHENDFVVAAKIDALGS